MITRTVKVPQEVIEQIDIRISMHEYSTRADFVLHALRELISDYAEVKRKLITDNGGIVPPESEIAQHLCGRTHGMIDWLNARTSELKQINTRVPEGLERKIEVLLKPEYGFKKKSDFTRVAIVHLIMILGEIDGVFGDAEKFAARHREISEVFNKVLTENIPKGLSTQELVEVLQKELKEKGYD